MPSRRCLVMNLVVVVVVVGVALQQAIQPTCATPQWNENIRWSNAKPEDYTSPPVLINKQVERVVGVGSNISLECTAQGSSPITFVWYQDERNLTNNQAQHSSNISAASPPQSTKLLDERRYEIVEETLQPNTTTSILYLYNLKTTDTSLFLCWVENAGGTSMANFTLIVNDSPPAGLAGGISYGSDHGRSGFLSSIFNNHHGEAQLGLLALLLFIILSIAVVLLLIVRQMKNGSSKASKSSDLKQIKSKHQPLSAGGKFIASSAADNSHQRTKFADSDEDGDNEYEDGRSSSNSSSSCKKNPKVMASGGEHLEGFLEQMRSGIINVDYHSMSPVMQFNNNTDTLSRKSSNMPTSTPNGTAINDQMLYHQHHLQQLQQHQHHQHQQQHQHHQQQLEQQLRLQQQQQLLSHQQPYLDTTDHHMMHHFPSASNTSTVPCYYDGNGGGGGGSASMTTTTSDLSPSSGSGNTDFTMTNGPIILPPYMATNSSIYMSYPPQ